MVKGNSAYNREPAVSGRLEVLNILNEVLASQVISCLRYKLQESMAMEIQACSMASEFSKFAQKAQYHVGLISERIMQLEDEPSFNLEKSLIGNHSLFTEGSSLQEMIKEDWVAERIAIDSLREKISAIADNEKITSCVLEKILVSKTEHADSLINLITSIDPLMINGSLHPKLSCI